MITFANVTKTFRNRRGEDVLALSNVSMDVASGQLVSIVGPSGCGKSTILRMIAGLEHSDRGKVTLGGKQVSRPSRDVSMMFQSSTLLPWFTVLKNVMLPLQVAGKSNGARERATSLLETVRLSAFVEKYPYQLSGGMQQRVAMCRALAVDPEVLLMDEPFGALDALTRERMNLELQRVWLASGKTIVLVTHSISESVFLSDKVIVMSQRPGRVLAEISIPLPRPRNFDETPAMPEYVRISSQIRNLLNIDEG